MHRFHLVAAVVARGVEHVQQKVGLLHLFQGGAKSGDQVGRQFLDETDGVGKENLAAVGQADQARGRIECDEQRVLHLHLRVRQRMEQGRFPAVGVTDDRDHRVGDPAPSFATQRRILPPSADDFAGINRFQMKRGAPRFET